MTSLVRLGFLLAFVLGINCALLDDARAHGGIAAVPIMSVIEAVRSGAVTSRNGTQLPPYNQTYYFEQLIDHNNPNLGTFKQRFYHTYEFYEPGGPIILSTPGEGPIDNFTGLLTNMSLNGQIAQEQNGSTIVLEHRFFGLSNPYPDLSAESLRVLTIQQAIDDLVYFAENVKLPMPNGAHLAPGEAPWILVGGSYAGALVSWTMVHKPGVFFAGYASSATVESITNFWQYFDIIRRHMPKNCSADVEAVISHIDHTFTHGTQAQINAIKDNFGLGVMTHLDDVAASLLYNILNWQSLQPFDGPGAQFFNFCDALEVKNGVKAGPHGRGLEHALPAWGAYWNSTYYEIQCRQYDAETCLGTYNASETYWTDTTINWWYRSWSWIVCNELGFYQDGAPFGVPTIASRLVQPKYYERFCVNFFPESFKTPPKPHVARTNAKYRGWHVEIDRLFFANGRRDPWRDATVSSDFHHRKSSRSQPIAVSDGFHASDLYTINGLLDPTILAVQKEALAAMKKWLSTWKPSKAHWHGAHRHVHRDASDEY